MIRISNIKLNLDYSNEDLKSVIAQQLSVSIKQIESFSLYKRSIDSRHKNNIHFVISVDVTLSIDEDVVLKKCAKNKNISKSTPYSYVLPKAKKLDQRPVVVGFGPAGMFCALVLARLNLCPIIIERGKKVDERTKDVLNFWNSGKLDTSSNVQFGEGGAGTFSDGKLNTGTKDSRIRFILEEFVKNGAPEEILFNSKPHIGTDNLKRIVKSMRKEIETLGGKFYFQSTLCSLNMIGDKLISIDISDPRCNITTIPTNNLVLAIGHSARDTFKMLLKSQIQILSKPFSVGVRIEHRREFINQIQYGKQNSNKNLPSADYKLAAHIPSGRGVYTFCTCPGGQVVAAASENNMLVTNGMSQFSRDMENSNSALLVSVSEKDFESEHPLAGMHFQQNLESIAFATGGGNFKAPVCRLEDFLQRRQSTCIGEVKPSYKPGFTLSDISECFPEFINDSLRNGLLLMNKRMHGFAHPDAILTAVETRSSSPIRILRDPKTMQSVNVEGLYPCGEGAGFAGGIMSAAVDGIRCAEMIAKT